MTLAKGKERHPHLTKVPRRFADKSHAENRFCRQSGGAFRFGTKPVKGEECVIYRAWFVSSLGWKVWLADKFEGIKQPVRFGLKSAKLPITGADRWVFFDLQTICQELPKENHVWPV